MKKTTLFFIIAAFIAGTAITHAQVWSSPSVSYYEDFNSSTMTSVKGTISSAPSNFSWGLNSNNLRFVSSAVASQTRSATFNFNNPNSTINIYKKATVEFDWAVRSLRATSTSAGNGAEAFVAFRDAGGNAIFVLSTPTFVTSNTALGTIYAGAGTPVVATGNAMPAVPVANKTAFTTVFTGAGTNAAATVEASIVWYHVTVVIDMDTRTVQITLTGIDGHTGTETLTLQLPSTYTLNTGFRDIQFGTLRTNTSLWWGTRIDNLDIKVTSYSEVTRYAAMVQAKLDSQSNPVFVQTLKPTLQAIINKTTASVNASSTDQELVNAITIISTVLTEFETFNPFIERGGTEFLNYNLSALSTMITTIAAANRTLLDAVTTATPITAALNTLKAAVESAVTTLKLVERVAPVTTPYRIYTYGEGVGQDGSGGDWTDNKRVLFVSESNTIGNTFRSAQSTTANNDMWYIVRTGYNSYTMQNTATKQYVEFVRDNDSDSRPGLYMTANPVEFTVVDGKPISGADFRDERYFGYGIVVSDGKGNCGLEVTRSAYGLKFYNNYTDRGRFVFQFEPVPIEMEYPEITPVADATGIDVNAEVKLTFTKPVNLFGEPNLNSINISNTMGVKASYSDNTITIAHNDFEPNTEYTVTIPKGSIVGCNVDITWKFKTGKADIEVLEVTPANNSTDVSVNAAVSVTFQKSPYLNEQPTWSLVTIKDAAGNSVPGITVYGMGISGNTYAISHKVFDYDTEYTVNIPQTAVSGLVSATTWKFKTAKPTGFDNLDADQVTVYPTVTSGKVQITTAGKAQISLRDLTGRTIETHNCAGGVYNLDLSGRPTGIYFVTVIANDKTSVNKIVKK